MFGVLLHLPLQLENGYVAINAPMALHIRQYHTCHLSIACSAAGTVPGPTLPSPASHGMH